MSERHRNIFCYYRGPRHSDATEKEEVLEDNLTKALMNTCDLCPGLGREFVRWLNRKVEKEPWDVRLDADAEEIYWGILETPDEEEMKTKDMKIMLGIVRHNSRPVRKPIGTNRPQFDGVIVGDNWLVGIESKVNGMNMSQFEQEKQRLDTKAGLIISWQEIHEFFYELDKGQCGEKEKLFIQQFTDYLKEIGQLSFQGLKEKHFDFFSRSRGEKERERLQLKDLINTLGADLWDYRDDTADFRVLYGGAWDWARGLNRNNSLEYAELKFYPSSRKGVDNQCYLCISFSSECQDILSVSAVLGSQTMFGRLLKVLKRDKKQLGLKLKDESLDGYTIQLLDNGWESRYKQTLPKSRDGRLIRRYLLELENRIAASKGNRDMTFELTVDLDRETMLSLDAKGQLEKIAQAMKSLHPFMQFANGLR